MDTSATSSGWNLLVARDDLSTAELVDALVPEIRDGEALLRVDRVGLTADNVTYAALGESFRYWEFFPTRAGWGIVPLRGFAEVVASRNGSGSPDRPLTPVRAVRVHGAVGPQAQPAPVPGTGRVWALVAPHPQAIPKTESSAMTDSAE
ncbi:DUF2855 family protein [Streptomyces sp. NPDC004647]|uniref:DUF2855 family protein n=1 Tax=Streptomyces sp. NPDC004647 TaxID=3154671 RepID=UPI0033B7796B